MASALLKAYWRHVETTVTGVCVVVQAVRPSSNLDVVVIDLDAMALPELLQERAAVKIAIAEISTQLMVQPRRPLTPEDESPEWLEFRDWRRRARLALVHRKKELEDIKQILRERQAEAHQQNEVRRANNPPPPPETILHTPEEHRTLWESAQARRATLLETLNKPEGVESLVLRLYRAMRHLLKDGDGLPEELDERDVDALREASIYLRAKYTSSGVRNYVMS